MHRGAQCRGARMSDRHDELLAKYLDGEIGDAEAAELLATLRSKPQELFRLRQLMALDERIRQTSIQDDSGERLARAVLTQLSGSGDDSDFARRVITRLPPRTSRSATRRRRNALEPSPWVPLGIAAAAVLLFVLALVVANRRSDPEERIARPPLLEIDPPESVHVEPETPKPAPPP